MLDDKALRPEDFQRAAETLGCDVPTIKAVCAVEAPGGGFLADGQVAILFERHKFSKLTGGRFDASDPDISNPRRGGYAGGIAEHARLRRAVQLDRDAALKSTSWGKFQIMGFNYASCGYPSLQSFINAMHHGEGAQLDAFVAFVLGNPLMHMALRRRDWAAFALRYNGANYAANRYDAKLAAAYRAAQP